MGQPNVRIANALGRNGGIFITDTAAHTGSFVAITAVAAAVADLVGNIDGTLTSVPIPVGTTIGGRYTSITLASGKVIAYY
jgi:hypothetical protein